jgi:N-acetylglucosaminyldiphosphoundecaprenol N-acetyl-beta-D-mannosaminyltransferase
MRTANPESADVLGVACAVGNPQAAAATAIDRALSGAGGYGVFCNVHLLMTAQHERRVASALSDAWLVFPDGAPVAWLQRRQGIPSANRIGGPDVMLEVMDAGRGKGVRHVLFGSTQAVVDGLQDRLLARFPGTQLVDVYAPAPGTEDSAECLTRLRDANADIIWCALGAPKQELWMQRAAPALETTLLLGVGAAFDFHSGKKKRAPLWMRRTGLEWMHRLFSEPRRLVRRYLVANTQFCIYAARSLLADRIVGRRRCL